MSVYNIIQRIGRENGLHNSIRRSKKMHPARKSWLLRGVGLVFVLSAFFFAYPSTATLQAEEMSGEALRRNVSVNLRDATFQEAIRQIEGAAGVSVTLEEGSLPSDNISIRLHNIALERALDIVFRQSGFAWEYVGSEIQLVAPDAVEGGGDQVFARYLSDYLSSRDRDRLSSRERDFIDDIRDPYNLTDREIDRIRDMPISERDIEDAYDDMRDDDRRTTTTDRRTTDRRTDDRRDRQIDRAPSTTTQQRAAGLAHMIQGVVDPGRWREREDVDLDEVRDRDVVDDVNNNDNNYD